MYCPNCRVEFRSGFFTCSDCDVALVAELPPEAVPETPLFTGELTTVWNTFDPFALAVAKSLLDDAEIRYVVAGENTTRLLGASSPMIGFNPVFGEYRVQVASDDAATAAELVKNVAEHLSVDDVAPADES